MPWCLCGWTINIKVSSTIRLDAFQASGGADTWNQTPETKFAKQKRFKKLSLSAKGYWWIFITPGASHIGSIFGHGLSFIDGKGLTRWMGARQGQKEPGRTRLPQCWSLWKRPGWTFNFIKNSIYRNICIPCRQADRNCVKSHIRHAHLSTTTPIYLEKSVIQKFWKGLKTLLKI